MTREELRALWRIAWSLGMAGYDDLAQATDETAQRKAHVAGLTFEDCCPDGDDQVQPNEDDWQALGKG